METSSTPNASGQGELGLMGCRDPLQQVGKNKTGKTLRILWLFSVCLRMNKRTLPEHKELSINLVCPFAGPALCNILRFGERKLSLKDFN